jgi:hypothetical protein
MDPYGVMKLRGRATQVQALDRKPAIYVWGNVIR